MIWEKLQKWAHDVVGYLVSGCCIDWDTVCLMWPRTCEEWTNVFGFLIAFFTLFFITLPKAWRNAKNFLEKRRYHDSGRRN